MRILHIITKLNEMYGAQRHAVESIKDHLAHGHTCMAIAGEVGYSSSILENVGVKVSKINSLKNSYNPITSAKAVRETTDIIKAFKPDLVISHSSIAGMIARIACYRQKIPNIFTVQGWPFEEGASLKQRIAGIITENILKPFSDQYLCVSNYTAKYGIKKLGFKNTDRIHVCGNMHIDKHEAVVLPFKINKNLLMVAGFRNQKDHLTAIRALKLVITRGKVPGLKLTFVGDGPKRKIIEDFIKEMKLDDAVVLAGQIEDVDTFYNDTDIVILPTFYEGLPLSLLEALQKAKPIIATNVGGINEMVFDNVNGNLLKVEDADSLANHIEDYYVNNKLQELSAQAQKVYAEKFSCKKISSDLNCIMEATLKNTVFKKAKYN